jgi:hypothetical protein
VEPFPCTTSPCVDPLFIPTASDLYMAGPSRFQAPTTQWIVNFADGALDVGNITSPFVFRAVRGGF